MNLVKNEYKKDLTQGFQGKKADAAIFKIGARVTQNNIFLLCLNEFGSWFFFDVF